jgi:hypothetical protein
MLCTFWKLLEALTCGVAYTLPSIASYGCEEAVGPANAEHAGTEYRGERVPSAAEVSEKKVLFWESLAGLYGWYRARDVKEAWARSRATKDRGDILC